MASILIVNDDGAASPYLPLLVDALQRQATVYVAVPATEQSWRGKAMTRFGPVHVERLDGMDVEAFAIHGTPADCVNVAVHHLLPEPPDWVLSGINVGANVGANYILVSGTVAAAFEGALLGLPSVAFSTKFPPHLFRQWMEEGHLDDAESQRILHTTALRTAAMMARLMAEGLPAGTMVLNVNFPGVVTPQTPTAWVPLQNMGYGSLFDHEDGAYYLRSSTRTLRRIGDTVGDRDVVERGEISVTPLSVLGLSLQGTKPLDL